MSKDQIRANYYSGGKTVHGDFYVDELPDSCPICHTGIEPPLRCAWYENSRIAAMFLCPKKECGRLFVSLYEKSVERKSSVPSITTYTYKGSTPWLPREHVFPEEIKTVSELFCKIYNESEEAEQLGLKNICGAGFRKALEFLVKDYLIKDRKVDAEVIKKTYLGTCIKKYVDEGNIKACAERAAWLGNDETHFYRVWEDKDLKDLKNLIELTVAWIHLESVTRKTIEGMPEARK